MIPASAVVGGHGVLGGQGAEEGGAGAGGRNMGESGGAETGLAGWAGWLVKHFIIILLFKENKCFGEMFGF